MANGIAVSSLAKGWARAFAAMGAVEALSAEQWQGLLFDGGNACLRTDVCSTTSSYRANFFP